MTADAAGKPVFLSAVVSVTPDSSPELSDLLTCFAAQNHDDFEVILAPIAGNPEAETVARECATLFQPLLGSRLSVANPTPNPLQEALAAASGMYASLLPSDAFIADNWVSTFLAAANEAPGNVIRCFAAHQVWTRGEAPITGVPTLFSALPIEPGYCSLIDERSLGDIAPIPSCSWAFPLFALKDFDLAPEEIGDGGRQWALFRGLVSICGLAQIREATSLERTWTAQPLEPVGEVLSREGIRSRIPPEAKEPLRRLLRRS